MDRSENTMLVDRVTALNIYPLKSAHAATVNGELPTSLPVGETGFEVNGVRDRDYVLFDPADNVFVSQRGWNAQERLRHRGDKILATVRLDIQADHTAVSSGIGRLELPNVPAAMGKHMTVEIFGKTLPAIEQAAEASHYFSHLLGREVLLLRSDHEQPRLLPDHYRRDDAFNLVSAADGYPFLLTNDASLAMAQARNGITPGAVEMGSYRGNIAIAGDEVGAFGEDYIGDQTRFQIGPVGFYAVKACMRCPIPNIDQETGEFAAVGGLKALRGRLGTLPGSDNRGVFFGQNLVHTNKGAISVGDPVVIASLSPEPNIDFSVE